MEAKILIEYTVIQDANSHTYDDYYKDGEYVKALYDDYNKTKDAVSQLMANNSVHRKSDAPFRKGSNNHTKTFKTLYTECPITIYNEHYQEESVDELIKKMLEPTAHVEIFAIHIAEADEEFLTEWTLWATEHKKISEYAKTQDEEWGLTHEPIRNLKLKFINHANNEVEINLQCCRLLDIMKENTFIVYIANMSLA